MKFLGLTIQNRYSREDVVYFLDESNSIKIFRQTIRKRVYLVKKQSKGIAVITKKWYEKGKFRNFKNYIKGGSRAVREAKNMLLLKKYGVGIPPLIAYGSYKKQNLHGFTSFIITEQLAGAEPYCEIVKRYYSQECPRKKFYPITEKIISEIVKMHLNGLTHNDIHIHNILVENKTTDNVNVYFLDTLAVKKRKNRIFYSLFDIAKFYFWMQNDPSRVIIQKKEREYIIREYFKKAIKIYHLNYFMFQFLVRSIANYIKRTYKFSKLIKNIQ